MLRKYEQELQKHIKVKLLGVTGEFVGTEFHQDLKLGICELKAPKYWETALTKFSKFFPNGVKERFNPMSVYDEKLMQDEVTDKEFEEAKDLLIESSAECCRTRHLAQSSNYDLCFCLWKAQAKVGCEAISSDDEGV